RARLDRGQRRVREHGDVGRRTDADDADGERARHGQVVEVAARRDVDVLGVHGGAGADVRLREVADHVDAGGDRDAGGAAGNADRERFDVVTVGRGDVEAAEAAARGRG